jgi:AraC family transcriptional regulator of adaptative response / DNA-3-methyladenine glycosylase II
LADTDLQITEIADRAGFKSLRRFNAAFADLYKQPPSDFRRRRPRPSGQDGKGSGAAA